MNAARTGGGLGAPEHEVSGGRGANHTGRAEGADRVQAALHGDIPHQRVAGKCTEERDHEAFAPTRGRADLAPRSCGWDAHPMRQRSASCERTLRRSSLDRRLRSPRRKARLHDHVELVLRSRERRRRCRARRAAVPVSQQRPSRGRRRTRTMVSRQSCPSEPVPRLRSRRAAVPRLHCETQSGLPAPYAKRRGVLVRGVDGEHPARGISDAVPVLTRDSRLGLVEDNVDRALNTWSVHQDRRYSGHRQTAVPRAASRERK